MYQGHSSDGSSIQKHSIGGVYPFVIAARCGQSGIEYGVIKPGQSSPEDWHTSYNHAYEEAWCLKGVSQL